MDRQTRQQTILAIIRTARVSTQRDLALALRRSGFEVTQSSVSRDLEELGIIKSNGRYTIPQNGNGSSLRGLIALIPVGENLIVAKCEAGLASSVAVEIDRASMEEIVGTLAGEDTVLIIVLDAHAQTRAVKKIWELFD
jgi:transcriptional regulator of arginine metabolism